jgi:lipopolysaccharide transport system permease protein
MTRSLWAYRGFIGGMVARDFRSRYLQSLLGAFWAVAVPLLMIAIYTLIFSQVMSARLQGSNDPLAYSLFLMAGLFPWTLFVETVTRCQTVFVEQGGLIKKAAFPRSSLPIASALSAAVNFIILFVLFLGVLALSGRWPGAALLAFVPLLLLQQALAIGLGVLLGTIHVFFRDTGHLTGVALQFWFWLTPIVYPAAIVPASVRGALGLNPMQKLMLAYQDVVLKGAWPSWGSLAPLAVMALLFLALGYLAFRNLSGELVDQL